MSNLLAYIPFVHPINFFHDWWYFLLLPLALGIAIIYKAVRLPALDHFWRQVLVMTAQIVLGMVALAIALVILVQVIVPLMRAE